MENTPEAPVTPEVKSEATPNTNPEPAQAQEAPAAPDMHGFTSEQLADMQKFFQANGGYEKVKSRISNPTPAPAEEQKPVDSPIPLERPINHEPEYKAPEGSITAQEFLAKQYFGALAHEEKYAGISKEIANGELLKEMAAFNISPLNRDGSINDQMVRRYLDLKAQTVAAKQTSAVPEASAAPTVDYIPVGDKITSAQQASQVLLQDSQLRAHGLAGHPSAKLAEDYMKELLNKKP